jgi:Fe-S-cluster-containing dehydrogenase component
VVCKDEHCDATWLPYAEAQPEIGQFWMKVNEKVRGTVPKVMISYSIHGCMHCRKCLGSEACVQGAFIRREDGLCYIDPAKCNGCKDCVDACPYHAVFFNEDKKLAQKCTGCAHLLDDGWDVPRCVEACPTAALQFGEEGDLSSLISHAEVLKPESGTSPAFYYLNIPKRFIAGEVYDPESDEVLIGATVILQKDDGTEVLKASSDDFGDFWFKQVEPDRYTLTYEQQGYLMRSQKVDATKTDINVGSIALYPSA